MYSSIINFVFRKSILNDKDFKKIVCIIIYLLKITLTNKYCDIDVISMNVVVVPGRVKIIYAYLY